MVLDIMTSDKRRQREVANNKLWRLRVACLRKIRDESGSPEEGASLRNVINRDRLMRGWVYEM